MSDRRMLRFVFTVNIIFSFFSISASIPEQGITRYTFYGNSDQGDCGGNSEVVVQNTKFAGSYFRVQLTSVTCTGESSEFTVTLGILSLKCSNRADSSCLLKSVTESSLDLNTEIITDYMHSKEMKFKCRKNQSIYPECEGCHWKGSNISDEAVKTNQTIPAVYVPKDGIYQFIVSVKNGADIAAVIESRAYYGYLSATDWPQLSFYRTMFALYVLYTFIWLVLCCCHHSDLLRIQYWIGGVIFIGLVEKAVFLGEYEALNKTGQSVYGAIILVELVSSARKMLSRILVLIVSVGFGIVKPHSGTTLHKLLAVGVVYFIASSTESCLRATGERIQQDRMAIIASLVLAVIDSAFCWWIISSLIRTMRTLRLRRSIVKLNLYRHFTIMLAFVFLASLGFMIWSFIEHQYAKCIQDWKGLWADEAFWHILFAMLLMVIMILWRPSANNQQYAYSPLTDVDDDGAEQPKVNEAFDGIKVHGSKSQENNSNKADAEMEDDLKGVDDKIPASIVDGALPSILDSGEYIVTTTYEWQDALKVHLHHTS